MSNENRRSANFWRGRGRGRGWKPYKQSKHSGNETQHNTNTNVESNPGTSSQNNQRLITDSYDSVPCPYVAWKRYHMQEEYKEGFGTVIKVRAVEKFIRKHINTFSAADILRRRAYTIDIRDLFADEEFIASWPTFEQELTENPEYSLNNLGLAMHQVSYEEIKRSLEKTTSEDTYVHVPIIQARISGFGPVLQLKHLKASMLNKLIAVRGTVLRTGSTKVVCVWLTFECSFCHNLQCVKQPEGAYTIPVRCRNEKCKSKEFTPLFSSPYNNCKNWQCIRVQEILTEEQRDGGRIPRLIECELTEDLLDSCLPGDLVIMIGILRMRNNVDDNDTPVSNMLLHFIESVSVINNKKNFKKSRDTILGEKIAAKDYKVIKEIHTQPSLFKLLVHSLCPTIYGHELVKAGMLLTLFGGTFKDFNCRYDPHMLVVGDPGLGKSQMLKACSSISSRGVYVCGNSSTSTGLTVTMVRENNGDHALEAGALVLADQGCCCIDEFDKMASQHSALLDVMEQQCVNIAKSGVICTLPARASVLAAANPVGGHYNRAKTVSENLRIGPSLLSRFDLVFILLDRPSGHLDSLLSDHVMALHSRVRRDPSQLSGESTNLENSSQEHRPLGERLKLAHGESIDSVPHRLLRKYLEYARKYINPTLTAEAAEVLQNFYLELRKQHQTIDSTPVTTRQLESLIRLSEARAKTELRQEVLASDALDVVEIMRRSLVDTFSDGIGNLDFGRSQHGSGLSSKNQAKRFMNVVQKQAELQSRSVFSLQELKQFSEQAALQVSDFGDFISSLNVQGFLLKKGPKLYQLLTVDY